MFLVFIVYLRKHLKTIGQFNCYDTCSLLTFFALLDTEQEYKNLYFIVV